MPYKEQWGEKAKERSIKRREYFKEYSKLRRKNNPEKVRASNNAWYYRKFGKFPEACGMNRVGIGSTGENVVQVLLKGSIIVRKKTHDIEWNNFTVEVKTATQSKPTHGWEFNIKLLQAKSDFIAFVCRKVDSVERIYLVPTKKIRHKIVKEKNHLTISVTDTKYRRYRVVL